MANITSTVAAPFLPEIWAQRALDVLRANIVLARLVARDIDYEPGWVGKQLNIPYPGTFTAQDKAADTAVTLQTPTGAVTKAVTLNKHKHVSFLVEDVARLQTNVNLIDRYVASAAIALAEAIEKDLFALYASLSNTVGTAGNNLTSAVLRDALRTLDENKAPTQPRYLVISPKDHVALLNDTALQNYFAFADRNAIANGAIARLYGFDVFMSQLVPVVTGTPDTTYNLAFHPEAFILAMRPMAEPPGGMAAGAQIATVVDQESGLAIQVVQSYSPQYLGVQVTLHVLYGVAVLRPELAVQVLS